MSVMMRRRLMGKKSDPNTLLLLHAEDYVDSSKYANPMANQGGVTLSDEGYFNKAFQFPGKSTGMLSTPVNPIFAFGYRDYTVELWVYPMKLNTSQGIFCTGQSYSVGNGIYIGYDSANRIEYYHTSDIDKAIRVSVSANVWTHVAAVRRSGTNTLYLNGVASGSAYSNVSLANQYPLHIGVEHYSSRALQFNGKIDELRVSNIARYTSNFTPPNAPFKS